MNSCLHFIFYSLLKKKKTHQNSEITEPKPMKKCEGSLLLFWFSKIKNKIEKIIVQTKIETVHTLGQL